MSPAITDHPLVSILMTVYNREKYGAAVHERNRREFEI